MSSGVTRVEVITSPAYHIVALRWSKQIITRAIVRRQRIGRSLAYAAARRHDSKLVSASQFHFGSWRAAVTAAGFDYDQCRLKPHWTRPEVIRVIKRAYRAGRNLRWSSVCKRRDRLGRAARAAINPRLFGSWPRSLAAAGLDADMISAYYRWTKVLVVSELRQRVADEAGLSAKEVSAEEPRLFAAGQRLFGSWAGALAKTGLNPHTAALRRVWTDQQVLAQLTKLARQYTVTDRWLRRKDLRLWGAVIRRYGTVRAALAKSH